MGARPLRQGASMTESELIALMATQVELEVARRSQSATVVRAFQPTHEGRDLSSPVIYVFPVAAAPRGWEAQSYSNPDMRPDDVDQHRQELWHTTFQFSARGARGGLAALDLLTMARGAFSSDLCRVAFRAAGTLPLTPGAIRQVYMQDEGGRQEAHPSFDVIMAHHRSMVDAWPALVDIVPELEVVP